ncbi:MAG: diaminopimelate epimerase [Lentisphaeria bacterium]|jgi:diaminopimelate epimerase
MNGDLRFSKMTAAGNDFICLDGRQPAAAELVRSPQLPERIRRLCRRGLGVGSDGLIVALAPSPGVFAAVAARFFDPDGSEVELCGNGTACFTEWALENGLAEGPDLLIQTPAGIAQGRRVADGPGRVRVCIPEPRDFILHRKVEAGDRVWTVHTVVTGVPHGVVLAGDELPELDVPHYGTLLRRHPEFGPRGVNVNFVQVLEPGRLAVRTFEFGVEAETLACGTGCASAAFLATLLLDWPEPYRQGETPVLVEVRGGETLKVWFTVKAGKSPPKVTSVCLEARVRPVYAGRLLPGFW